MGSFAWSCKSPNMVRTIVPLLNTTLKATHEPPSKPLPYSNPHSLIVTLTVAL